MGKHAQTKTVISPLYAPKGWAKQMVEEGREFAKTRAFNTILSGVAAAGTVLGALALILGWLSIGNNNSHDIQMLQTQMTQLTQQISKLSDKIDQGPRADQLTEIVKHLSALDGRMDADERRQSDDEQNLVRAQTQIESIRSATGAQLGARRN